jgi:hypothetical protein
MTENGEVPPPVPPRNGKVGVRNWDDGIGESKVECQQIEAHHNLIN